MGKFETERAAEKIRMAEMIKNGYCPKCQSYCHGDCTAN
jgi:hypothetical protein